MQLHMHSPARLHRSGGGGVEDQLGDVSFKTSPRLALLVRYQMLAKLLVAEVSVQACQDMLCHVFEVHCPIALEACLHMACHVCEETLSPHVVAHGVPCLNWKFARACHAMILSTPCL